MIRTAADFEGRWRLQRQLTDHLGTMSGSLVGEATFDPVDETTVVYTESGTLSLISGARLQAERRYHWAWLNDRVVVTFADGAAFHHFVPDGAVAGTPHLCGADLYTVAYDFTGWPSWQAVWQVKGPRKNYTSVSEYSRD